MTTGFVRLFKLNHLLVLFKGLLGLACFSGLCGERQCLVPTRQRPPPKALTVCLIESVLNSDEVFILVTFVISTNISI